MDVRMGLHLRVSLCDAPREHSEGSKPYDPLNRHRKNIGKIQHLFMIKPLNKVVTEGMYFNVTEAL